MKEDSEEINIGFTTCYIKDYKFKHLFDIPAEAALEIVKQIPKILDKTLGDEIKVSDLDKESMIGGGWLDKRFIVFDYSHGYWYSVYKHGYKFSIRRVKSEI